MDPTVLDNIRQYLDRLKVAGEHDKVYKKEAVYSFDTPESESGLFVNLATLQAVSEEFLALDHGKTGMGLYLWMKWTRVPVHLTEEELAQEEKPEMVDGVLKIPVMSARWEHAKEHALVVMPQGTRIPLPCEDLPQLVTLAVDAVIAHEDAVKLEQVQMVEFERQVSKYAVNLVQLDNGKKISPDPSTWKCEESGMTENLWLNLSTGHIGSGRRNWDGSGGTGAALRHFEETGSMYPLVVKLGTITPDAADVFSYAPDENEMVIDPLIDQHLAHWGIDREKMRKTDKSMDELMVDLNMRIEFDLIQESGTDLVSVCEPGIVGLQNTGNSCYINSVMQVLFSLPEFRQRYADNADAIFERSPMNAVIDFNSQMAKLGVALCLDAYVERIKTSQTRNAQREQAEKDKEAGGGAAGVDEEEHVSLEEDFTIAPLMLRQIVGRDHPEFSTNRQQDAHDYYMHLLDHIQRAELGDPSVNPGPSLTKLFEFEVEEKVQCAVTHKVRYSHTPANTLEIPIPEDAATNMAEVLEYDRTLEEREAAAAVAKAEALAAGVSEKDAHVRVSSKDRPKLIVPFETCVERMLEDEMLQDWDSPATQQKGDAIKTTRVSQFPKYLLVKMKRYVPNPDWTARKIDAEVVVPEVLDLSALKGNGLQPGEEELPADAGSSGGAPQIEPDEVIVMQIVSMGFSENAAKRACIATQNAGAEMAMGWVFEHESDPDLNYPPEPSGGGGGGGGGGGDGFDPASVMMLASMGFDESKCKKALKATGGDMERATTWLLSHLDDDGMDGDGDGDVAMGDAGGASAATSLDTGKFKLLGFVSHMGPNTTSGHYVAHIHKQLSSGEKSWIIFNDRKTAISQNPPFGHGYLYLYEQVEE